MISNRFKRWVPLAFFRNHFAPNQLPKLHRVIGFLSFLWPQLRTPAVAYYLAAWSVAGWSKNGGGTSTLDVEADWEKKVQTKMRMRLLKSEQRGNYPWFCIRQIEIRFSIGIINFSFTVLFNAEHIKRTVKLWGRLVLHSLRGDEYQKICRDNMLQLILGLKLMLIWCSNFESDVITDIILA